MLVPTASITLFELAPGAWLIAIAAVVLGAMLQGSLGFGLGLVASPILVLLDPSLVPGAVIGMGVPLGLLILWRERDSVDISVVRWAIAGRLPGAVVGSLAVVALGTRSLSIVFAVAILSAVGISATGLTIRQSNATMLAAGFVSGVSGTATSVGGPPIALVLQNRSGPELRSALAAYYAFGSSISLALLTFVGEFRGRELGVAALLMPATVTGFLVSGRTNKILDRGYTRPAVLAVAAVSAVAILLRTL